MSTLIENISILIENIEENINELDLKETILDFSLRADTRMRALELYCSIEQENSIEVINKLTGIYQFSGSKVLEHFLYQICSTSNLSSFFKLESAKSLQIFNEKRNLGYDALNIVCENMIDIPTPCKVDSIFLLMKSSKYIINSLHYFFKIINDPLLENSYRYKIILSLENQNIENKLYFITESCICFLNNPNNMTLYRILSSQYLLRSKNNNNITCKYEEILLSFCYDNDLDYNLRADSADTLLRYGSESNKIIARDIIMLLGRGSTNIKTLFSNSQNVHIEEIEQSVLEILEFLNTIPIDYCFISFEYIKSQIEKYIKEKIDKSIYTLEKIDKIHISLNRINVDRILYSKYNCSLNNIFIKVYSYIYTHEFKNIMFDRLLEELIDMSGTCSTGFASRIINTITGFGELSIRISFEDQIVANVFGRLNAKIREIKDEDLQSKILEEMSLPTTNCISMIDRSNFYKFFRDYIPNLKEELYSEFKTFMNDSDFDLYMRKAIMIYETGDKFL